MNDLTQTSAYKQSECIQLNRPELSPSFFALIAALIAAAAYLGYRLGNPEPSVPVEYAAITEMQIKVFEHKDEISQLRQNSQAHLDALAMRMGKMQSELIRIEALGQRLAAMAKLDKGEFDFDQVPAQGGPAEVGESLQFVRPELKQALDGLETQLDNRARQLEVLERLVMNKELTEQLSPAGRPITKGWTSSYYGKRTDPFNGRRAMHKGMDFAGKRGADINATAAGVVTWAGKRYGYGNLVEINHGSGYSTRYGHCRKVLVKVGDKVEPGQKVALMGSTGRSTGPHVHYEVLKNGRQINPRKFIRASR
ncbi:MAG: M23 family metallopeptidase [Gammaproteobacteria bacterium]